MAFRRDPLSVAFDPAARALVSDAIKAWKSSRRKTDPRWVPAIVESPQDDPREDGPDRLSRHERAFQRAMYYDPRVYGHSPDKAWALTVSWGEIIGRRRMLRVRVFSDTTGARHAGSYNRGRSYTRNPALRSIAAAERDR